LTPQAAAARWKLRWSASATRYSSSRRFIACRTPSRKPSGSLFFGRQADQVVEGGERCPRPFAHGDDDLLVGRGRAVASGENAGDRGLAMPVDDDLAARVE